MRWTDHFQNRPRIYNWLHRLRLAKPVSQTHPTERACLCRHLEAAHTAVEIGTYMGVTAAEMAAAMPEDGKLYCIDPYHGGDAIKSIAQRHLRRSGMADKIEMLFCTGDEALDTLPREVDFFFVDGDHSYEGLLRDWKVVKEVLRPRGIAAFHDTAIFPGATAISHESVRCFDEVIRPDPSFEFVEKCKSLNVIRRKQAS